MTYARSRGSEVGVDPQFAATDDEKRPYGKVSAKLSSKDNVEFAIDDNIFYAPNAASRTEPLETQSIEHGHNPVITTRWTRSIAGATLFELRGGGIYIRDRFDPQNDNFTTSQRYDIETGLTCCNTTQVSRSYQNRTTIDASLAHNADDFLMGSHDFKFGVQWGSALAQSNANRFNNAFFYDLDGAPYQAFVRDPTATGGRVRELGGYARDNWTLSERVVLNLGIRYDTTRASIPEMHAYDARVQNPTDVTFPALDDILSFNDVSPRLGATVRLDESGKTVLKGSYGRYFGKTNTNLFNTLSPGNTNSYVYGYNAATGKYDILQRVTDPRVNFLIDPDLTNEYTDQVFVGIEREVMPDFGVNASFVYKKNANLIRGRDIGSTYAPRNIVDTFRGVTQTITVFNRATPASAVRNQVTNRDDLDGDYKTFILQANKRFSSAWQVQASYQWQRAVGWAGNGTGVGSQTGQGTFGADPNQLVNAFGRMATDSTHAVKLNIALQLPGNVHIGAREAFETGRPYGRTITVRGLSQGSTTILAQSRSSYERPSTNDLQLRVDKDFLLGGRRKLRLALDIFNIFNADTPLTVAINSSQTIPFSQTQSIFLPRRANVTTRFEF
jgi:outer membrane receptor protein involved in Fe transport